VPEPLTILAVGDVGIMRDNPATMFRGCREALSAGTVTFGQLETTVSDRGSQVPHANLAMRAPASMARAVAEAGFDVMSFAGNHCLDWGYDAFHDTLRHLSEAGIRLCGAGPNIEAARQPSIIETEGLKIAFLAYSSILPQGYWADRSRAGCAPLRVHTVYEQIEHDQPGTPPRIRTFAHSHDLKALLNDVARAKAETDLVIVSFHWGLHMVRADLAEYQRDVARAVIEAGADAIVGHHPHLLKGIEFFRGAPIFYSLGNFAIEQPHIWDPEITKTDSFRHLVSLNPAWDAAKTYRLPEETRRTGIAKLVIHSGKIAETRFLPAYIADDSAPIILSQNDAAFGATASYLNEINGAASLKTAVSIDGDELMLQPA
jgi:poly-gamma-glutamate capsule biosynthesis protein CapA/YwtB (metallophosphatase superfamily)